MNTKKMMIFIIVVLFVFTLSPFAKVKKITRVGVYPLLCVEGGIQTPEQLKELLENNPALIEKAFAEADASFLYDGFMEKVMAGEIQADQLPKGQEIPWMAFKVGNKVKVARDMVWAANRTLEVLGLTVQHECKDYVLVVPKGCGNLTLMDIRNSVPTCAIAVTPETPNVGDEITVDLSASQCAVRYEISVMRDGEEIDFKKLVDPVWKMKIDQSGNYLFKAKAFNIDGVASPGDCEAALNFNSLPVCDLTVTPARGTPATTFTLDASGSSDPDGTVVKAEFTIKDEEGNVVNQNTVEGEPLIWETKVGEVGAYKIWLKVTDDAGAVSANVCEFDLMVRKGITPLVEFGPMVAKGTYTGYIFARLGLSFAIVPEKISLITSAGGAVTFTDQRFKNHFLSNVLLNFHFDRFYIGAGLGYSTEVTDTWSGGLDIVGNLGFYLFERASIFGEFRYPIREDLGLDEVHQFFLGFRYEF